MFHLNPHQQSKYRMGRKCAIEDQVFLHRDLNDVTVPTILPSSFVGSSKWYHMLYLDALCLPHRFHAPDLFLTFTCNPKWPEITSALPHGHKWQDHPDLVARVFWIKFQMMMRDIVEYEIFGPVRAFVWRIEWQARGLPHVHLLIILVDALRSPRQIDAVICAEVPDPEAFPELHAIVQELMIHQPCDMNPSAGCREKNKICKRRFPKTMSTATIILGNKFPKYRRRGRFHCKVGDRHVSDDWVVPYCPFLLLKYGAHINLECASHVKSFKYVYKYVLKSPDKAGIVINEIQSFLCGRLLSCSEAAWRLLGFPLHKEWPPVCRLQIHLPNEHTLLVDPTADDSVVSAAANQSTSTLLQWFELNNNDPAARNLLYVEVPEHYTWLQQHKQWSKRQRGFSVGRILQVSSRNQELFALKRLLSVVKGATSWSCLLSVDGFCYDNFQSACCARGLTADDGDIIAAFQEIRDLSCSVPHMRREFAHLLIHRSCANATGLFNMFASDLCDRGVVNHDSCMEALWAIEDEMAIQGRSLTEADFGFRLSPRADAAQAMPACWRRHVFDQDECDTQVASILPKFTDNQRAAMDVVLRAVSGEGGNVIAVLAGAGCGKSLFVNGVTWSLRAAGKIVINVAASALAATLLPNGTTAHSAFRIPIPATDASFCGFKSSERALIKICSCIFYDEVSMVSSEVASTLDRSLRDLMREPNLPFGGKVICFLGDFKQLLPVGPRKYVATIKDCEWWHQCRVLQFTKNFRAVINPDYCNFLEDVGHGRLAFITVPPESLALNEQDIINRVYGDISTVTLSNNLIMAFTLETCKLINNMCMSALTTHIFDAAAVDDAKDNNDPDCFTSEYIASLPLHGVPPPLLPIIVGARYMIIVNYDATAGICNGIFGELLSATRNVVQLKLLSGMQKGKIVVLPRCSIHVSCENSGLPFAFTRVQFPLIPGYCVSVHKSQGQSLDVVGLIADQDSFAHGQVYTALSRTSGWAKIYVLMKDRFLMNLVHKHVL
jgi:hypothetical protein